MALSILNWSPLSAEERRAALRRPVQQGAAAIQERVREIIGDVRARGDAALLELTRRFDGVALSAIEDCTRRGATTGDRPRYRQRAAIS
jgi:histidinol dehydrogenase